MSEFKFTHQDLINVRDYPSYYLGRLLGKTKLTKIHDEWIHYLWDSNEHRALQAHRGGYKTTAVIEVGPVRWFLFNPNDRVFIIKETYEMAAASIFATRCFFETEAIRELYKFAHGFYPEFTVKKENKLTFNFKKEITREGNLQAFGLDGAYIGYHPDKVFLDDAITIKDRISKAKRESAIIQIQELMTNIIEVGQGLSALGTPWHPKDGWTVLPRPVCYPVGDTGLLTAEEIARKKQTTTKVMYACNYDLNHITSDDAIFKDPHYQAWDYQLKAKRYAHLDAAYEGDCTNALTIMAQRPNKDLQAIGYMFTEHIKDKIKFVVDQLYKHQVSDLWIEENADKGWAASLLKAEIQSRGLNVVVHEYHESMNKDIKIVSYLKYYWDIIYWATESDPEYLAQVLDYREKEKPNDCADSGASLTRVFFSSDSDDAMNKW